RAIQRSAILIALTLFLVVMIFPESIGARWALYSETLSPDSAAFELGYRAWNYPVDNFKAAFKDPHWVLGNGIGTSSLGVQYITGLLGARAPQPWVESGYGVLILEMGLLGLALWLAWTVHATIASWKVIRSLKQSPYAPVALAIGWFSLIL